MTGLDILAAAEYPDVPKFLPLPKICGKHCSRRKRRQISKIH